jgi:CrcB protein
MTTALVWIGVVALGGCGAMIRTAVGAAIDARKRVPFPLGTFTINVSGSLLAGVLYGAAVVHDAKLLLSTALIGAYTTFSTLMVDSERLARTGHVEIAAFNVFASVLVGLGAVLVGKAIGELLF